MRLHRLNLLDQQIATGYRQQLRPVLDLDADRTNVELRVEGRGQVISAACTPPHDDWSATPSPFDNVKSSGRWRDGGEDQVQLEAQLRILLAQ
jgi:hypothetical protein